MKCEICGSSVTRLRLVRGRGVCRECLLRASSLRRASSRSKGANIHIFKPRWMEHLGVSPVYVESKVQLEDECKKRHLKAALVWDKTDSMDYGDAMYKEEYGER